MANKTLLPLVILALSIFSFSHQAFAKNTVVRKSQDINFSETDLKGTVRNPEGAYLVQKKSLKFMPLHEVEKDMDKKIKSSAQMVE